MMRADKSKGCSASTSVGASQPPGPERHHLCCVSTAVPPAPLRVMGPQGTTPKGWLPAPPLHNSSCSHPRFAAVTGSWGLSGVYATDAVQAAFVLALSAGVLGANLLLVLGLNARRYSRFIHAQPRYLLTSLAVNDLAIGLLVTPFAFLPSLLRCWPYGETFCQIQALLRGALSQQSAVILICMAIDRYMCMLHPVRYHRHSSKKGCVAVMSVTWVTSVTLYAAMVLPRRYGGFHFNATGLHACEPWYPRASLRILASCLLYFPTTMVLMYCYGSAFHVNKLRLKHRAVVCSAAAAVSLPDTLAGAAVQKLVAQERRLSAAASRTMAAISLGFIVMVTPWTIQEVVAACTGSKVPPFMDFVVTWLALSNSFWNPFLYWLLNANFRRVCRELLCRGGGQNIESIPPPPGPGLPRGEHCCAVRGHTGHLPPPEEAGEKHWGEILERTVSSSSLLALQRIYGRPGDPPRLFSTHT